MRFFSSTRIVLNFVVAIRSVSLGIDSERSIE